MVLVIRITVCACARALGRVVGSSMSAWTVSMPWLVISVAALLVASRVIARMEYCFGRTGSWWTVSRIERPCWPVAPKMTSLDIVGWDIGVSVLLMLDVHSGSLYRLFVVCTG